MRSDNPRVKVGSNSGNTSDYLADQFEEGGEIKKLPAGEAVNKTLVELANLEAQKKEIGARIRELSKSHVENGGTKFALSVIRRIQKMDPDERESAFAEIDAYGAFLRYW